MSALDETLEVVNLRTQAMRRIRAGIVYGEIAPGEVHSAPALAARLGVSITPVREALLELTYRGMVTQVRNRGFRIVEHSPADLDAALELRRLVEVPMLMRLAATFDPADARHLRSLVRDGVKAARAADYSAFLDLDRRFHLGLLALAGNPRVVDVVDQVLDQLRLSAFHEPGRGAPLVEVAGGHREILAAVEARDAKAVERAAGAHLTLTRSAWSPER
ncbi:MAG TPA: GntR family transcriptional regulator [Solirubrobacteraceae bacterium]|nr:GntR family transcriptional regulator [Solirubrobacteraceae bacterium]